MPVPPRPAHAAPDGHRRDAHRLFRFCIRQGHLPSHLAKPGKLEERDKNAKRALDKQMRLRRADGLNLPYGPAAERMKLACEGPWAPDPPDPPF